MENKEEEQVKILINKMRVYMRDNNFKAIRMGLLVYNKYFNNLDRYEKYIIIYNLALCYKKVGMYNEGLKFLQEAKLFTNDTEQGYYRIKWLENELKIELKIDNKEEILNNYLECSKYYKKINSKIMRAYVLYNIAKYKKDGTKMFYMLKSIIKESDIIIPVFINYNKRADVLDILNDLKKVNYNIYKNACNYLNIEVVDHR